MVTEEHIPSPQGSQAAPATAGELPADTTGVVQPHRVRVWEDELRRLNVTVDGEQHQDVRAVWTFPLSGKTDYVSFLDEHGKEVLLLARPNELDKESRRALHAALERMYYVARILRIYSIRETMGISQWEVLTDRGYAAFEVVDRDLIRRLPGGRYLMADADGNRFEIPDAIRLDPRSQSLLASET